MTPRGLFQKIEGEGLLSNLLYENRAPLITRQRRPKKRELGTGIAHRGESPLTVLTLPGFKPESKAVGVKVVSRWRNNRFIDQRNRVETPEINPRLFWPTNLRQRSQDHVMGKGSLFGKRCWENDG